MLTANAELQTCRLRMGDTYTDTCALQNMMPTLHNSNSEKKSSFVCCICLNNMTELSDKHEAVYVTVSQNSVKDAEMNSSLSRPS